MVPRELAERLLSAVHRDTVANLSSPPEAALYLAPYAGGDADYVSQLAARTGVELLDVPAAGGLERWDSGLSILFNGCHHPKVICADGQAADFYPEDLERARRKLDLYEIIVGREGESGCWLIGMHGYSDFLTRVRPQGNEFLHALLEAGVEQGQQVSVLDTKKSVRGGPDLDHLRFLARRPQHPNLRRVLDEGGLLVPPARDEG